MTKPTSDNPYIQGALPVVFVKTAAPIILMMLVNGSFNLIDAAFLGRYVGAEALTAVTSMFPLMMLMIACSTWVGNGFASVVGRLLGAGKRAQARQALTQAFTLAVLFCLMLMAIFLLVGPTLTLAANGGNEHLASMSWQYMSLVIVGSPLMFVMTLNGDALRSEGFAGFVAVVSILSVGLNIVANYLFIAVLGWGVAGSALGTLLAQALSLMAVVVFRLRMAPEARLPVFRLSAQRRHWSSFIALGAPSSLNYIGLALSSAAILLNLQLWSLDSYATTVSAYGILTRIMTFVFLPLLGLSMAFQSIVGNNAGAKAHDRTNAAIRLALLISMTYCLIVETTLWLLKNQVGFWFVDNPVVVQEVSRILPVMTLTLVLFGPLLMISMYFQSLGDALRAAILGLSKTYLFALPLIFLLPLYWGEWGIWYAGPSAEILALLLTIVVLRQRSRQTDLRFGLFQPVLAGNPREH
ncbi:MATE family efflux transporter [Reinekea blandensis]|uniref:Multidrug export protein MepA n=1 Tax=Reinekea blandensis MED297 TaxID=314283 RepID=A4BAW6_9GAMM|nr:MATE family efflux transporter [Reinekea blandensis]EAR10579.1 Multi antimicrobial extrusion protein MatE [Reinekea sp. MED297] [Reinekea blandensis MED297]